VATEQEFRHVGGGSKGLFLALRYVFIVTASYLLLFEGRPGPATPGTALAIAAALASNVGLSFLPQGVLFAWWLAAPLLFADAIWVAWLLLVSGGAGEEFFLLYFFVLLLAAVGESLPMVVLGAVVTGGLNLWFTWSRAAWTSGALLRVVFFVSVALFYGHVLTRLKRERIRGDRSAEWARLLEAKVFERTAQLHRLYEESRAASRAKSDCLASMSHELRTPLHIIIGYAEMLREGIPADEVDELAGRVRSAATGLLTLVDGVLEMGRLESGTVPIVPRRVPVADFVEQLQQREWLTPLPGVTLRWDRGPARAEVETDPGKLQIMLANLLTNALKYTTEGSVALRVRDESDAVVFEVADTGPGIPPERLARMREPFHESTAGAQRVHGIGLGLAIVHGYAALLKAGVEVGSVVGRGTTFRVRVPHTLPPVSQAG